MDWGTDPLCSGLYSREHARAAESLSTPKLGFMDAMRQRKEWSNYTLEDLKDRCITPDMLVASGATWGTLQSKHGAQALIEFGYRWPTMLASGFCGSHLATLRYDQLVALGLTAPRMMECKIRAQDLSALNLGADQLAELGWTSAYLCKIGISMPNMVNFGFSLQAWRDTLGVNNFESLGFTNYTDCARAGWRVADIQLALQRVPTTHSKPLATSKMGATGKIQFI